MAQQKIPTPRLEVRRHQSLEFELVGLIAACPLQSQRRLAERLGVSVGTVNGLLKRLLSEQVIAPTQASERRMRPFVVTGTGKRKLSQAVSWYFSVRAAEIDRAASLLAELRHKLYAGNRS